MSYKMPAKLRNIASRFSIGMLVEIRDVIATRYAGKHGTVISVHRSTHNHTLDKYIVRLSSGIEKEFWDIQLQKVQVAT
jgi:hypothetical protein